MSLLLAAAGTVPPAGDGAPARDIALIGAGISLVTVALLALIVSYRRGGGRPLRALEAVVCRFIHVPGWAALPSLGAIVAAVITFMGAIWDISVHIDQGRDSGPFGTPAHYPLLVGLVLTYLMGVLAVGMAPRRGERTSPSAVAVPGLWPVPVGGLLILAGGGFAMLGFPLDDLWHRLFGQDVTLWGPTHTMFFGGLLAAAVGAVILRAEGARSLGRDPFNGWGLWRKPLPGVLGGIFLFVGAHATDEFNWGVAQYPQVWHPLLLAFFGALGLVVARSLGGRGGTIAALAAYLPLQLIEVVMIGALGQTTPASPLFVAEALVVELVMWRVARRPGVGAGALAGLGVGTLGFAAEYAWSQLAMPLPWHASLLPAAIPSAALGGAVLAIALAVNASITNNPANLTATMRLTNFHQATTAGGGRTQVADLRVRLSDPDLAVDPNWAYVLGWQGGGRFLADLARQGDGTLLASKPVPVGGKWKSFVRFQKGRIQVAAPIRMPADRAVDFAGFPAEDQVTRSLVRDTKLLQIERKKDGPLWAWTPALLLVMSLNLSLMALVGAAAVRAGRPPGGGRRDADPDTERELVAGGRLSAQLGT